MSSKALISVSTTAFFTLLAMSTELAAPTHHHYKLIDMGTLGGPASSINFPFSQDTLNNEGIATGWSATSFPISGGI